MHSLLDLPCLSAALELLRQGAMKSENPPSHIETALEKFTDHRYKPMFTFLVRNQSGFGDTIDRFDPKLYFTDILQSETNNRDFKI